MKARITFFKAIINVLIQLPTNRQANQSSRYAKMKEMAQIKGQTTHDVQTQVKL